MTASRLADLADLVLSHRLAALERAAAARDTTARQIAGLADVPAGDMDPLTAARLALHYQRWADARRAGLNLVLARQTADWLAARDAATAAFGRASVTARLAGRPHR